MSKARNKNAPPGPLLRVAHVWLDEVMDDHVLVEPGAVTIGNQKTSTLVLPPLGLPDDFAIIEAETSDAGTSYVLTLKQTMSGRMQIDGKEMDVAEFMDKGSGVGDRGIDGSFRKTTISSGDWGVIELDGEGTHNLFFQFVKDSVLPTSQKMRHSELVAPALAFSMIMHLVLLTITYQLYDGEGAFTFPGRQSIMTKYLVERPPEPVKGESEKSADKDGEKKKVKSATKGKKGKSGGKGDKERARDPQPSDIPDEVKVGLVSDESRQTIKKITENRALDDKLQAGLARLQGNKRLGKLGAGPGSGTGVGSGKGGTGTTRGSKKGGSGGGGSARGDFTSQGKVDVGESRSPKGSGGGGRAPKEVKVGTGTVSGDLGGLSKEEIDRVVKSRKGLIRACYQRELNRSRGLGGKLVVNFRIAGNGKVKSARVVKGKSSLKNKKVSSCIMRQIKKLKFPAKGGGVVNYPFIFSQG